jgi:hypothetical protein
MFLAIGYFACVTKGCQVVTMTRVITARDTLDTDNVDQGPRNIASRKTTIFPLSSFGYIDLGAQRSPSFLRTRVPPQKFQGL